MSDGNSPDGTGTERERLPRLLPVAAWASFVLNVLIIGTGGAVRLSGSGLGCSDWPLCTPESLFPTPEQSYHSLIEFGNRTISGPILLAAVIVWILSWRLRRERRDLPVLASLVLGGVLLQALIGGIVVWMHLNANLVGVHYFLSVVLVCLTAAFLARMREEPGPRIRSAPKPFVILTHATSAVLAVTVIFGILTTGAGPHSGDVGIERDGFDATLLSHIHAWPGYLFAALILVLLVWAARARLRPLPWLVALLCVTVVQIVVGVWQARDGLPEILVGIHMVLAAINAAAMTVVILRLKRPAPAPAPAQPSPIPHTT
ncbi:COX15/CtaA family protein [Leucobacter weissii]|uniref:COX15/CtaA family protein n=1 Tax=Leucobacter weissii TaxID=1983706 RepID=UPI001FB7F80B|nr:COX15/CtaA family protein [Leucobacter weissii]